MEIYIIKNKINNYVYIGKSNNSKHRWEQHVSGAKHTPKSFIDSKMKEYGIDNFCYAVLEKNIKPSDANDREKYWISFFNCMYPNGYNKTIGGDGVIGENGYSLTAKIKDESVLNNIRKEIIEKNDSFENIAKKYNVGIDTIVGINNGKYYKDSSLKYPLRAKLYSDELIKDLVYSLKYEKDKTLQDIAKEYEIDYSQLSEINQGKIHRVEWVTYPIRSGKVTNPLSEHYQEIIDLLSNSNMSQKEIARKFNTSVSSISAINKGRSYRNDSLRYPLRDNYQTGSPRKSLSPNEVKEIEKLLKNTNKSMRAIASDYEVALTTILNINIGNIKKYRKSKIKYPIRNI